MGMGISTNDDIVSAVKQQHAWIWLR